MAVAGWYGWRVGDRFSYYQAGFDPAWSRYSVGFLLLAETVREAIAEGAAEYDLLLGDEAFKARFATGSGSGDRCCWRRASSPTAARAESPARGCAPPGRPSGALGPRAEARAR